MGATIGSNSWTSNTTVTYGGGNAFMYYQPYAITSGGSGYSSASFAPPEPPEPRKATAMDWLDGEVENVCKIARQVG